MKFVSLLMVIVLTLFSMTSCQLTQNNDGYENGGGIEDGGTGSCSHRWVSATCTKPKTCSKCETTSGSALGHTTNSGKCSRCGESLNSSSWIIGEYTDEFEQPTGKKYIVVDSNGTFSNSATTDSDLYAALQIDQTEIRIMLWEYGRNLVKGIYDYETYSVTILDEAGTKHSYTGIIYQGSTRITIPSTNRSALFSLLENNDSLKIYLKTSKYSISTYLFTIDTRGFAEAYDKIS